MDRIKVSDAALSNSLVVLQRLADQSAQATNTCVQQLSAQLSEMDSEFRKDVEKYIADVKALHKKLNDCVYENIAALNDRLKNLAEYETHNYIKRNIG